MKKNIDTLTAGTYDLVIVGGGIHGAVLALAAARAGFKTALFEKGDFGHSTSANSLKIIHGGIRYLQHGDFKRMRESIASRRAMMAFAPHLVKPLACLMPTYGHGIKGREIMRTAFAVYDMVAFDRNRGLPADNRLPQGTSISADEVKWAVPGIQEKGLTGGAIWYDAIAGSTERLVLEYVLEAARYGADVANYTEVIGVQKAGDRIAGVTVRDLSTGSTITVNSRIVVNAAGPWLERLAGGRFRGAGQLWATAANIVVKKRLFRKYAVGLEGYTEYTDRDALIKRGKRLFFFVPWQEDYTMIGTSYKPYRGAVDDFVLQRRDVAEIVDDINKIYPPAQLTMADVTFCHGGLLPMTEADAADANRADSVQLDKSSQIIDHGADGMPGLFSIKGVKYTTAPDIADKMVRLLQDEKWFGPRTSGSSGSYKAVPPNRLDHGPTIRELGGEYERIRKYLEGLYGTRWRSVFGMLVQQDGRNKGDGLWLSEEPALLFAEVRYFVREEMASTLADVVFRRSNLGSAECPGLSILTRIAEVMGGELSWTGEEQERQIAAVLQVYAPLTEMGAA
ncbi:MAG TPA: glycerol-3-phosphate dehydrogenase/oxidase [Desulfobulbaceae bacterium]|nr:glycerol-3-phosphate dehydrogenase/oxidase [Desulfobulbaceae bacterium]